MEEDDTNRNDTIVLTASASTHEGAMNESAGGVSSGLIAGNKDKLNGGTMDKVTISVSRAVSTVTTVPIGQEHDPSEGLVIPSFP